jgi:hypothetical protein
MLNKMGFRSVLVSKEFNRSLIRILALLQFDQLWWLLIFLSLSTEVL